MQGNPKTKNSHKEHRDGDGIFVLYVFFVANGCF